MFPEGAEQKSVCSAFFKHLSEALNFEQPGCPYNLHQSAELACPPPSPGYGGISLVPTFLFLLLQFWVDKPGRNCSWVLRQPEGCTFFFWIHSVPGERGLLPVLFLPSAWGFVCHMWHRGLKTRLKKTLGKHLKGHKPRKGVPSYGSFLLSPLCCKTCREEEEKGIFCVQ